MFKYKSLMFFFSSIETNFFVCCSIFYVHREKIHIVFVLVLDYHVNMDETRLCWIRSFGRVQFSHIFRTKHENHLAFDQIFQETGKNCFIFIAVSEIV